MSSTGHFLRVGAHYLSDEEKNRLQKEYKQMLAEMKKSSQEEAVERLDSSTKKILFENRRMAEELRLQVGETDDLQKAKKGLEEDTKRLRREVALNEQSVKEYAKQGFRQSKEIKELSAKVKHLERSLAQSLQTADKEREALAQADSRKLREVEDVLSDPQAPSDAPLVDELRTLLYAEAT